MPRLSGSEVTAERLAGALEGRYRLIHEAGRGRMATVFLAKDEMYGRHVAIKMFHSNVSAAIGAPRFLREIAVASQLSHPNILSLHDSGEVDGILFYVMPFVPGESLRDRLGREQQLSVEDAVAITSEVADALSYAHGQGVVHRDIKPENILLADGHAIVADFGIARAIDEAGSDKLTETGLAGGTPQYMSPERAGGADVIDGRSDQYSLACVTYEMLSGQPPFTGPTARAILAKHTLDPVPRVSMLRGTVPPGMDTAIAKALSKSATDRFVTTTAYAEAMEQALAIPPPTRRRWSLSLGVGVAMAAALLLFGWSMLRDRGLDLLNAAGPIGIVVMPFDVHEADPDLQHLRAGATQLLYHAFTGEAGIPSAADPRLVLRLWSEMGGNDSTEIPAARVIEIAQRLGARLMMEGTVRGSPSQLTLVTTVRDLSSGTTVAQARVEGRYEEIGSLMAQMAAMSIAELGGNPTLLLENHLRETPAEALTAFIAGGAAMRQNDHRDAVTHYREALAVDSNFAPAIVALWTASKQPGAGIGMEERGRLWDRALALRNRLAERDRVYLEAFRHAQGSLDGIDATRRALELNPNDPDLLEAYFWHLLVGGSAHGIAKWQRDGWNAYTRRMELLGRESNAQTIATLLGIGYREAVLDTHSVAERARQFLALHDLDSLGTAGPWDVSRHWFAASILGDTLESRRLVANVDRWANLGIARWLSLHAVFSGLPLDAWEGLVNTLVARALTTSDVNEATAERMTLAMVRGYTAEAATLLGTNVEDDRAARIVAIEQYVLEGTYEHAARQSAAALRATQEQFPDTVIDHFDNPYVRVCYTAIWDVAKPDRDTSDVRAKLEQLQSIATERTLPGVCPLLLEAMLEDVGARPRGRYAHIHLDSLLKGGGADESRVQFAFANALVARWFAVQGENEKALAAARRYWFNADWRRVMPAYFYEEARLCVAVGDTAAAVDAYQRYFNARPNPDGPLRLGWEGARRQYAALVEAGWE